MTNRYSQNYNKSTKRSSSAGSKNDSCPQYGSVAMLGAEDSKIAVVRKAELFWGCDLANSLKFIWDSKNIPTKRAANETDHERTVKMELGISHSQNPLRSIWTPRKMEQDFWIEQKLGRLKSEHGPRFMQSEFLTLPPTDDLRKKARKHQGLNVVSNEQTNVMQTSQTNDTNGFALPMISSWPPKNMQKSLSFPVMPLEKGLNKSAPTGSSWHSPNVDTDIFPAHSLCPSAFRSPKKFQRKVWDNAKVNFSEAPNQSGSSDDTSQERMYSFCETKNQTNRALMPSLDAKIDDAPQPGMYLKCGRSETDVAFSAYHGPLYLCNNHNRK